MTVTDEALDLIAGDPPRFPHVPGDFHRHPTTGAPYVTHPETGKQVMYGRPSSFGSALDNPLNLVKWKERQLLIGVGILEQTNIGRYPLDIDPDDRDALDRLAARCHDAAGSHLAADQGTHIHRLLEQYDQGLFDDGEWQLLDDGALLGIPTMLQNIIVDQWRLFRQRHGLSALAVEQTVVNDRWRLAGTLDRLDVADRDILTAYGVLEAGVPFVGDIKSGGLTLGNDGQPNYWVKYPVQLAAYVDAVPYDTEADERLLWSQIVPPMNRRADPNPDIALIYHYDLGRALAGEVVDWHIIPVNVQAGREGGDRCRAAADFAKRRDLFAMPAPTNPAVVEQAVGPESPTASSVVPGSAATIDRGELVDRVKELFRWHPEAEAIIRRDWPVGVRTLKHDDLSATELAMILGAVRRVEAEVGASWVDGDVTSRSGAINRARKAWKESGRTEDEMWFSATSIATFEQCRNPDATLDGLIRQFTIEQADRLTDAANAATE